MDNAEIAKIAALGLRSLIDNYLQEKPTDEELKRVYSIYHKIVKLDPRYSYMKNDIYLLHNLPAGVLI